MNRRELFEFFVRGAATLSVCAVSGEPAFARNAEHSISFWAALHLLKNNIDQGFLDRPGLLDVVRQRFHISNTAWEIKAAAFVQMWNTVSEFGHSNPWDTDQTRHEKITPPRLRDRYVGRVSRLFHEHVAPIYSQILGLPVAKYELEFTKQFGEIDKLCEHGLVSQLGCITKVNEQSRVVAVDPDWNDLTKHPRWTRLSLNIDYMCDRLSIPRLLHFTDDELRAAGVPIEQRPQRSVNTAPAVPLVETLVNTLRQ